MVRKTPEDAGEYNFAPLVERLEDLRAEFRHQSFNPPREDPISGAFAKAVHEDFNNPDLVNIFREALEYRPHMEAEYCAMLFRNVIQWQLLHVEGFPERFHDPQRFRFEINRRLSDKSGYESGYETTLFAMKYWNVAASRAGRYKSLKLPVFFGAGYTLDPNPTIIDVGPGLGVGLKALAADPEEGWMEPVELVQLADTPYSEDQIRSLQDSLNRALQYKWPLGECWGLEIMPKDPVLEEFMFSCGHPPTQLLDTESVQKYITLMKKVDPRVHIVHNTDFTKPADVQRALPPSVQGDILNLSTVLYMMPPEKRKLAFKQGVELVKPNGLIIVQDFADVDPEIPPDEDGHRFNLRFHKRIYSGSYKYKTFVYYPHRPEEGFKEWFVWENGSCERGALGKAFTERLDSEKPF